MSIKTHGGEQGTDVQERVVLMLPSGGDQHEYSGRANDRTKTSEGNAFWHHTLLAIDVYLRGPGRHHQNTRQRSASVAVSDGAILGVPAVRVMFCADTRRRWQCVENRPSLAAAVPLAIRYFRDRCLPDWRYAI